MSLPLPCGSYCLVCSPQHGRQDLSACVCKKLRRCKPPGGDDETDPWPHAICGIINQTPDGGRGGGGNHGGGGGFGGDFEQGGETDPQPPGPFDDPGGEESSESNYQNSNLPTKMLSKNPFIRGRGQSFNLLQSPSTNVPSNRTSRSTIGGTRDSTNSNLPFNIKKSIPSTPLRPFAEFGLADRSLEIYDRLHNIEVLTNQFTLLYADMWGTKSMGEDPHSILTDVINLTLNDVLRTQGGRTFVPFNGVTIGAYLKGSSIVESCLGEDTKEQLEQIEKTNLTALNTAQYLKDAMKTAIKDGTLGDYSIPFLKDIVRDALPFYPRGLPNPVEGNERQTAFNLLRNQGRSLYPRSYTNADDQRLVQRYRPLPTDIDLTLSIVNQSGETTGIRFNNQDDLIFKSYKYPQDPVHPIPQPVVKCCYCGSAPQQSGNDTLKVITMGGREVIVGLKSNRDIAYDFNYSQLSMIQGLLKTDQQFGVDLTVSAPTVSVDDIERTGGSLEIPECLLFSSMRSTITDIDSPKSELRTTQGKYALAWKSGDEDKFFNATVSAFSGPRMSFYIAADDPIWNLILTPDAHDGQQYITALFTDINITLDGKIFPRKFLTDFCIFPTDVTKYNPFQGNSILAEYTEGSPIERTIKMILNPFADVQSDDYVKVHSNPQGTEADNFNLLFTKAFKTGDKTKILSKTGEGLISKKSTLGTALDLISDIDTNYNLEDGWMGSRLPKGDFLSFFTVNEYLDFIQRIPLKVRWNIFEGVYNNIKVFPIKLSDTEKTYISSERLTGTSMASQQKQTTTPQDLGYFDPRYKGRLYF